MDSESPHELTRLLRGWQAGDKEATNRLMELGYSELHQVAAREMRREHGGHTV